jgi:hypothetical protein
MVLRLLASISRSRTLSSAPRVRSSARGPLSCCFLSPSNRSFAQASGPFLLPRQAAASFKIFRAASSDAPHEGAAHNLRGTGRDAMVTQTHSEHSACTTKPMFIGRGRKGQERRRGNDLGSQCTLQPRPFVTRHQRYSKRSRALAFRNPRLTNPLTVCV